MKIIFWGGGPANVFLATLLAERHPQHRIEIYEKNETLGGNHTWSFHESAVPKTLRAWLAPFVSYSWPGQSVCFPKYERQFESPYQTVLSEDLHRMTLQKLRALPNVQLNLGVAAEPASLIQSDLIFDGRGLSGEPADRFNPGFQKFLGLEVELTRDHGLTQPILMDARVPQVDGFRFFYVLPLTNTRLLIEDTYYSNEPHFDQERLRSEIRQYAFSRGWQFRRLIREEAGCLSIPIAAPKLTTARDPKILATGLRGGFFHPTTGHSLIEGLKLADALSVHEIIQPGQLREMYWAYRRHHQESISYFYLLNKALFFGAKPQLRYKTFEHFYTLPADYIDRFYSANFATADKWRLLMSRPHVLPSQFMLENLGRHFKSEPHWAEAGDAPLLS